jgi:hypothetical protein
MTKIKLQHAMHKVPQRVEAFYDGLAVAVDGLIELDANEINQIRAAYFRGYNTTPDGRWLSGFQELDDYVASAKSEEEGHEPRKKGTHSRG